MTEGTPLDHQPDSLSNAGDVGILVHGYWLSEKGKRTDLGLRSSITARAGAVEYHRLVAIGQKPKVFVNLDNMWGPNEPTEGSLMANRFNSRYHIPQENIVAREDAWSTWGEVKSFVEEAKMRGWRKLVDIAFRPHHITIPRIFRGFGVEPTYKTAEEILREKDVHRFEKTYNAIKVLDVDKDGNPKPWKQIPIAERQYAELDTERTVKHERNHTARLVDNLTYSRYGAVYWLYEGIKWVLTHRPGFNYETLEQRNKDLRKGKGPDSPLPDPLRFDVYVLNGKKS